jgi:hypothetical protein
MMTVPFDVLVALILMIPLALAQPPETRQQGECLNGGIGYSIKTVGGVCIAYQHSLYHALSPVKSSCIPICIPVYHSLQASLRHVLSAVRSILDLCSIYDHASFTRSLWAFICVESAFYNRSISKSISSSSLPGPHQVRKQRGDD